jgi:hypothetical protein
VFDDEHPIRKLPGGTTSISTPDAECRTRQARPVAVIAARRLLLVTITGSGFASSKVAQLGTETDTYVKLFGRLIAPFTPTTDTSVVPTEPGGVRAVTVCPLTTFTSVASTPPTRTAVVPRRFEPVMVM